MKNIYFFITLLSCNAAVLGMESNTQAPRIPQKLITGFQSIKAAPENTRNCWSIFVSDANQVINSPIVEDLELGLAQEVNSLPATNALAQLLQLMNNNIMNAHIQNANAITTTNQTIQTAIAKNALAMAGLGLVNLGFILYTVYGK
ncbi:MAG: hypothetical protein WC707_04905 [Candidatus Babeliaceae bacterium]|jgi:hypothetical protein